MKKGSLIEIKKNNEGTYDFTDVDTGRGFAGNVPAAEVKRWEWRQYTRIFLQN